MSGVADEGPYSRVPTRKARSRRRHERLRQQRATEALVTQWISQYGRAGSGRLARPELAALLAHLHPEAGPPDEAALDTLITQATEVRATNITVGGDPNASIRHEMIMDVCTGYSMHLLARVALERRAGLMGVIALKDMPALLREANAGSAWGSAGLASSQVSLTRLTRLSRLSIPHALQ